MMKKLLTALVCSLAIVTLSGCVTQTVSFDKPAKSTPEKSHWTVFAFGIIPVYNDPVDAEALCEGSENIAKVQTQRDAVSIFINYGAFSLNKFTVYCAKSE